MTGIMLLAQIMPDGGPEVGGAVAKRVPAHRAVLGASSDYFKTLLSGGFLEGEEGGAASSFPVVGCVSCPAVVTWPRPHPSPQLQRLHVSCARLVWQSSVRRPCHGTPWHWQVPGGDNHVAVGVLIQGQLHH